MRSVRDPRWQFVLASVSAIIPRLLGRLLHICYTTIKQTLYTMSRCQTRRPEFIPMPKSRVHPLIVIEVSVLLISSPDFGILSLSNLGLVPSCNQSGLRRFVLPVEQYYRPATQRPMDRQQKLQPDKRERNHIADGDCQM